VKPLPQLHEGYLHVIEGHRQEDDTPESRMARVRNFESLNNIPPAAVYSKTIQNLITYGKRKDSERNMPTSKGQSRRPIAINITDRSSSSSEDNN